MNSFSAAADAKDGITFSLVQFLYMQDMSFSTQQYRRYLLGQTLFMAPIVELEPSHGMQMIHAPICTHPNQLGRGEEARGNCFPDLRFPQGRGRCL